MAQVGIVSDLEVFGFAVEETPGFNVRVRSLLLFVVLSVIFLSLILFRLSI